MRMAVGGLIRRDTDAATEIVMFVFPGARRQAFEHSLQIFVQKGFVFIDDDRSGCVFGLHIDPAVSDARAGDDLFHLVGDVYELQTLIGPQADNAVMRPDRGLTDLFNTCHLVHNLSCVTSSYRAAATFKAIQPQRSRAARIRASMWFRYFSRAQRPFLVRRYSVFGIRPTNDLATEM